MLEDLRILRVKKSYFLILLSFPVFILWLIRCVAETNRTPFDFSEGESELVSGFNVEYGRYLFAILFMREYGVILFLRALRGALFFKVSFSSLGGVFLILFFSFF